MPEGFSEKFTIKLLIVTREAHADKRYGIAKSLSPVLEQMGQTGVNTVYLCQADLSPRNKIMLSKFHQCITQLIALWPRKWLLTNLSDLSFGIIERLNMGRLAAKIAKQNQFSHVHCHDPLIAAGFQFCYKKKTIKHGITQHGFGSYTHALHEDGVALGPWIMRRMRHWEGRILQRAHWVSCPTRAGLNQLARDIGHYPIPAHWTAITHPKPDFPLLNREHARAQLAWQQDCIHIISVGRHAPLKNFPLLVKACAQLTTTRQWHLTILGDGDWQHLRELAKSAGIGEQQLTLHACDDITPWYAAADLYVSTSTTESFGMANHEAICAGLPCLLTAVAAVPEAARNAASYIPAGDVNSLTVALDHLINNDLSRVQLAQRAAQYAQHWPSSKDIANSYLSCYQGDIQELLPQELPSRPDINTGQWAYTLSQLCLFTQPQPLQFRENSRILIFAPHPDDETFSLGGSILEMRQQHCEICIVLMTRPENRGRIEEFEEVMSLYGIKDIYYLNETDGQLQNTMVVRDQLSHLIQQFNPDLIFSSPILDLHRDHIQTGLAVIQCWAELDYPARLFFYEFWQPLTATHFIDISAHKDQKYQAIKIYQDPLSEFPYNTTCQMLQSYRANILANANKDAEAFLEIRPEYAQTIINASIQLRGLIN